MNHLEVLSDLKEIIAENEKYLKQAKAHKHKCNYGANIILLHALKQKVTE